MVLVVLHVYLCICVFVYIPHMCKCPWRSEEMLGLLGPGATMVWASLLGVNRLRPSGRNRNYLCLQSPLSNLSVTDLFLSSSGGAVLGNMGVGPHVSADKCSSTKTGSCSVLQVGLKLKSLAQTGPWTNIVLALSAKLLRWLLYTVWRLSSYYSIVNFITGRKVRTGWILVLLVSWFITFPTHTWFNEDLMMANSGNVRLSYVN